MHLLWGYSRRVSQRLFFKADMFDEYILPTLHTVQISHCGLRTENQDSVMQVRTVDGALLCLLADGFGRHGRAVSTFVVKRLARLYAWYSRAATDVLLQALVEHVHSYVSGWREHIHPEIETGGCTLEMLVVQPGRVLLAHAGDSRSYLLRGTHLNLLTQDHTIPGLLVEQGILTLEQVTTHMYRNQLLRFIGSGKSPAADYYDVAVQPGDRLLVCSDGVWAHLIREDIVSRLYRSTPTEAANALIRLALKRGSEDNLSLIIVQVLA